jgi:hypothetical protein
VPVLVHVLNFPIHNCYRNLPLYPVQYGSDGNADPYRNRHLYAWCTLYYCPHDDIKRVYSQPERAAEAVATRISRCCGSVYLLSLP